MKNVYNLHIALIGCLILLNACKKTNNPTDVVQQPTIDYSKTYTISGNLVKTDANGNFVPIRGRKLALSQINYPTDSDIVCFTDTAGYFSISYQPVNNNLNLMLHPWLNSYACVFSSIAILENIPKGKNINFGTVYTPLLR